GGRASARGRWRAACLRSWGAGTARAAPALPPPLLQGVRASARRARRRGRGGAWVVGACVTSLTGVGESEGACADAAGSDVDRGRGQRAGPDFLLGAADPGLAAGGGA